MISFEHVFEGKTLATVKVAHGMDWSDQEGAKPHFISEIFVRDQNFRLVKKKVFTAADVEQPTMKFMVPAGATELVAYEVCNLHGVWQSSVTKVKQNVQNNKDEI